MTGTRPPSSAGCEPSGTATPTRETADAETPLRAKALAAFEAREAESAARREESRRRAAEAEAERQAEELSLVQRSYLAEWFPDQEWEWIGRVQDGVVARAKDTDIAFVVVRQARVVAKPSDLSILIVAPERGDRWLVDATRVGTLADIGAVIHRRERPAPEPVSAS